MYSKTKPQPYDTDHRGTKLEAGKKVAFNRSGDVEIGEIISFKSEWKKDPYTKTTNHKGETYWRHYFTLEVQRENGLKQGEAMTSTIKNYKSFIII